MPRIRPPRTFTDPTGRTYPANQWTHVPEITPWMQQRIDARAVTVTDDPPPPPVHTGHIGKPLHLPDTPPETVAIQVIEAADPDTLLGP